MQMVIHGANGLSPEVKTFLESGVWMTTGSRVVKDNTRRTIYHLPGAGDRPGLYVKHDHPVNPRDLLKVLWRCKARQEYEAGMLLAAAGVPVVGMLAWGRSGRHSFLVTRELIGARVLADFLVELDREPAAQPVFLARLAGFLNRLVTTGVRHPDLHAGNVLVTGPVAEPQLVLVDVHGVTTGARGAITRSQVRVFAVSVLSALQVTAQHAFFRRLDPRATVADIEADRRRAYGVIRKTFRRRWVGRRRGFLRTSRVCTRHRDAAGCWRIRDGVPLDAPARWLAAYKALPAAAPAWLKRDGKRALARVADGPDSCVVKEFRRPGPWGRWRSDRRGWVNTHMCEVIGVPVMRALAWLQARDGRGLIFFQDGGVVGLRRALRLPMGRWQRRSLLSQVAWVFGRLHACGILHGDSKASNFLVVPAAQIKTRLSPWVRRGLETVAMVDTDSLTQSANLSRAECADNLRSWRASLPDGFRMTRYEMARFLITYSLMTGLTRSERRALADLCGT